ncbi:tripartite tricarboxylate transporter substrate binding protein, partial [Pseudomonas syringae]
AGVEHDVVQFYADVLRKVSETPEWEKYLADSSQSPGFVTGDELKAVIEKDGATVGEVLKREGWLAN